MNNTTKKKYLKIINTHKQICISLGENAPYISKGRIITLTLNSLKGQKIKGSRSVIYSALKKIKKLKREELFLND